MLGPASSSSASLHRLTGLALSVGCLLAVGCGGKSVGVARAKPIAQRVCGGVQGAGVAQLGYPVSARIVHRAVADLECVLIGRRVRVDVVSQASARAYTEFDTTTSHQEQVYGPGVHEPGQIPSAISVPGAVVAVWIRAQREIVATDAMPTTGGTYVTVTVAGRASRGQMALALAQAVARATFAAHPDAAT